MNHGAPDLDRLLTEQDDHRYRAIDRMSTAELAAAMCTAEAEGTDAVRNALPSISAAIAAARQRFTEGGRLVYVGAGTSGRLGVLDAAECPPTFHTDPSRVIGLIAGGRVAVTTAVEGVEDDMAAGRTDIDAVLVGPADTVVGLTASGRTPYVIAAVQQARLLGALTIGLSCTSSAELSAHVDYPIEVLVGPEVLTGSTRLKAGSAQKQVLNMISTILMVHSGKTYGNLMVDLNATNAKLLARAQRLVRRLTGAETSVATETLVAADKEVKTAIVMLALDVTATDARRILAKVDGRLDVVLGIPSSEHPALSR